MSALRRAQEHHRDACLDNHSEEDCVAIQLAQELTRDVEKLRGDMHHLIAPIVGLLRLAQYREESLTDETLTHTISRLSLALNLMDEAVVGTVVPDEDRGKHGVGLNHYPSLIDPDASPCIGAPHGDKK